jgi:hypothetical protein
VLCQSTGFGATFGIAIGKDAFKDGFFSRMVGDSSPASAHRPCFSSAQFDPLQAQFGALATELTRLASLESIDTTSPEPSGRWRQQW